MKLKKPIKELSGAALADKIYPIEPKRRELFQRLIENYDHVHDIAHRLHFLDCHFPPTKLDRALAWLVSNHYTGAKFICWFKDQCRGSDLEMHRLLLHVVDNEPLDRIIAGRNFQI